MEIIKILSEQIGEELDDAEHYAQMANQWKEEFPDTAKLFADLANAEMDHQARLHDHVVRLINKVKSEKGAPPPQMLGVYNYLHAKHVDHAAKIMALQKIYNT